MPLGLIVWIVLIIILFGGLRLFAIVLCTLIVALIIGVIIDIFKVIKK